MAIDPLKKVAARYTGSDEQILPASFGPYFDGEGNPYIQTVKNADTKLPSFGIVPGGVFQVYPQEVYGQTLWHDPRGVQKSIFVGIGHVTFPQHAGLAKEELMEMGYDFQGKRSDMEPVLSYAELLASQSTQTPSVPSQVQPDVMQAPVQEEQHTGNTQPLEAIAPSAE